MTLAVYHSAAFATASGVQVAANATVEVRREDTGALASIYADRDGVTPLSNPFNADSLGRFTFYAAGLADGYRIKVTAGAQEHTLNYVPIGTAQYLDGAGIDMEIDFSIFHAQGTVPNTANQTPHMFHTTFTPGGSSTYVNAWRFTSTSEGAVAFSGHQALEVKARHAGSATADNVGGGQLYGGITAGGNASFVYGLWASVGIESLSSGTIAVGNPLFVQSPDLSGAGGITTLAGLRVKDQGHATKVTTALGVDVEDFTAGPTLAAALRSAMTSGTGKYHLYLSGTASTYHEGSLQVGNATSRTLGNANKVQITGTTAATSSLGISAWSADALGARIELGKSRGASIGTNTIVVSGDVLASVTAYGADGTNFDPAASVSFEVDGTPGSGTDMPGRIRFLTSPDGTATLTEAMRIDQGQRVIIGGSVNATGYKFQIHGEATATPGGSVSNWVNDATSGKFDFTKSRGAIGVYTIVAANDVLGSMTFWGADGTSIRAAARIQAEVDGAPGASDMPGRIVFSTTPDTSATPAERLRISHNGNVKLWAGTAIPAGGTAGFGYCATSTANFGTFFGSGEPSLSAAKGSIYLRSDGTTTNNRAYINTDGGTTWTALTTVA